nr:hypothetical protein [Tanacetum cinerariifolium]
MDARLDALSIDFDEELYPHMLTAIVGCRWIIGHDLRLAVMKCGDSLELRQAFTNVVSAWLVKGMSEGLAHGIEHAAEAKNGDLTKELESLHTQFSDLQGMSEGLAHGIEHGKVGRDLEVMKAYDPEANSKYLQALQELKDLKEDAPKWIRDLRPSTSQLKIPVYPK